MESNYVYTYVAYNINSYSHWACLFKSLYLFLRILFLYLRESMSRGRGKGREKEKQIPL